jgi:predicted O-methyltransferase YrrM
VKWWVGRVKNSAVFLKKMDKSDEICKKISKITKVLEKIESLEESWTCEIDEKNNEGKVIGKRQTHLRSVPPSTGKLLKFLILANKSKNILELGCSSGYSALWMAQAILELGEGHIFTTEILKDKVKFAKTNFKEGGVEDIITLYEGDITEILDKWNKNQVDFIFMDADKEKYPLYYARLYSILNSGGLIVVDNALTHKKEMEPFIKLLSKDKRIIFDILPLDSGLVLIYKR